MISNEEAIDFLRSILDFDGTEVVGCKARRDPISGRGELVVDFVSFVPKYEKQRPAPVCKRNHNTTALYRCSFSNWHDLNPCEVRR